MGAEEAAESEPLAPQAERARARAAVPAPRAVRRERGDRALGGAFRIGGVER